MMVGKGRFLLLLDAIAMPEVVQANVVQTCLCPYCSPRLLQIYERAAVPASQIQRCFHRVLKALEAPQLQYVEARSSFFRVLLSARDSTPRSRSTSAHWSVRISFSRAPVKMRRRIAPMIQGMNPAGLPPHQYLAQTRELFLEKETALVFSSRYFSTCRQGFVLSGRRPCDSHQLKNLDKSGNRPIGGVGRIRHFAMKPHHVDARQFRQASLRPSRQEMKFGDPPVLLAGPFFASALDMMLKELLQHRPEAIACPSSLSN